MTYNLELTKEQLQAISHACETCARIHMLQFDMIADHVGKGIAGDKFCEVRDLLEETAKKIKEVIPNQKREESANVLWDIYQVARHRLSWDRLKKAGKTKPDFSSVQYDEPFKTAQAPLVKITQ